jgi:hypothetical protein
MTTVDMGGGLSASTNSEMSKSAEGTLARPLSFPPEGADSCLNTSLAADLSSLVFEGCAKWVVEVAHSLLLPTRVGPDSSASESSMYASSPVQVSVFPGMSMLAISSLVSAFFWVPFCDNLLCLSSASKSSDCPILVLRFGF